MDPIFHTLLRIGLCSVQYNKRKCHCCTNGSPQEWYESILLLQCVLSTCGKASKVRNESRSAKKKKKNPKRKVTENRLIQSSSLNGYFNVSLRFSDKWTESCRRATDPFYPLSGQNVAPLGVSYFFCISLGDSSSAMVYECGETLRSLATPREM